MSTASTTPGLAAPEPHEEAGNYLQTPGSLGRKIASWAVTLDHKRIGLMYLAFIIFSLFLGGAFAVVVRMELFAPGRQFIDADTYNKVFTLHGAIMVFLFIIPSIPAALGNFFLPLMLGAKDVAFPRLNLASLYVYAIGAVFAVYSMMQGSVDTGWTFYTPYSTDTPTSVIPMLTGAFVLGFSSIFTGINFIVTIHKLRPPGMTWFRMPLFLWALYGTALIQVLSTPVLGITLLLLIIERTLHIGIFDPLMGGDPVLFQHFFWFYSHPAVYIMILPAMGIVSELISTHSRKPIFGYYFVAFSSLAIALIGFLVWGHHMFVAGQSELAAMIFSFLTALVSVPSAIKVFNWTATLYRGSISLRAPMLYALSFLFLFTIGGLTGLFLMALPTNVHLTDTYFVVAHFHYVMVGGTLVAFLGGLHHWWPKMFGRMYPERLAQITAAVVFFGFNVTFFPMFLLGTRGMPRRYWTYADEYTFLHQVATMGLVFLGVGLVVMLGYFIWSLFRGEKAPANPWGAATLEWQTQSPPISGNFEGQPIVRGGPYDYGVPSDEATIKA